jgi:hypothetical protein
MASDDGCGGCLAIVGVLVLCGIVWVWSTLSDVQRKNAQDEQKARVDLVARERKIPLNNVGFSGLRLSAGGGYGRLVGRIANSSRDSVSDVEMKVTILDCVSPRSVSGACTVVASPVVTVYETIPPGESRDFDSFVSLPGALQFRGHMEWNYVLTKVVATSP